MIKHVVMWKFKEGTENEMKQFLDELMKLKDKIDWIREMEVGIDIKGNENYDAILISKFDSMEDLERYKVDPRHVAVSGLCKEIRVDRVAVDFEV